MAAIRRRIIANTPPVECEVRSSVGSSRATSVPCRHAPGDLGDLRSDAVTRPTDATRRGDGNGRGVGDDGYGEETRPSRPGGLRRAGRRSRGLRAVGDDGQPVALRLLGGPARSWSVAASTSCSEDGAAGATRPPRRASSTTRTGSPRPGAVARRSRPSTTDGCQSARCSSRDTRMHPRAGARGRRARRGGRGRGGPADPASTAPAIRRRAGDRVPAAAMPQSRRRVMTSLSGVRRQISSVLAVKPNLMDRGEHERKRLDDVARPRSLWAPPASSPRAPRRAASTRPPPSEQLAARSPSDSPTPEASIRRRSRRGVDVVFRPQPPPRSSSPRQQTESLSALIADVVALMSPFRQSTTQPRPRAIRGRSAEF